VVEIRDMGLKYHILGSNCHLVFNKVNTTQRVVFHVIKFWSHGLHFINTIVAPVFEGLTHEY
jgi:hypothetical protein